MVNDKKIFPNLKSWCENCTWYLGNFKCPAYPNGIPEKVWNGKHNKVNDNQSTDLIYKTKGNIL